MLQYGYIIIALISQTEISDEGLRKNSEIFVKKCSRMHSCVLWDRLWETDLRKNVFFLQQGKNWGDSSKEDLVTILAEPLTLPWFLLLLLILLPASQYFWACGWGSLKYGNCGARATGTQQGVPSHPKTQRFFALSLDECPSPRYLACHSWRTTSHRIPSHMDLYMWRDSQKLYDLGNTAHLSSHHFHFQLLLVLLPSVRTMNLEQHKVHL